MAVVYTSLGLEMLINNEYRPGRNTTSSSEAHNLELQSGSRGRINFDDPQEHRKIACLPDDVVL